MFAPGADAVSGSNRITASPAPDEQHAPVRLDARPALDGRRAWLEATRFCGGRWWASLVRGRRGRRGCGDGVGSRLRRRLREGRDALPVCRRACRRAADHVPREALLPGDAGLVDADARPHDGRAVPGPHGPYSCQRVCAALPDGVRRNPPSRHEVAGAHDAGRQRAVRSAAAQLQRQYRRRLQGPVSAGTSGCGRVSRARRCSARAG